MVLAVAARGVMRVLLLSRGNQRSAAQDTLTHNGVMVVCRAGGPQGHGKKGSQSAWAMCCCWMPLLCHSAPDATLLHRAHHRVLHGAQTEDIDDVIHQVPFGTAAHIFGAAQPAGRAPTISPL